MGKLSPPHEPSDRDLVTQVRNGETEAFAPLVERHHSRVMRVLLRLCEDFDTAEELADRAFLLAFERIDQLKDQDEPGKWFVGIAVNTWKMLARRRSRLVSLTRIEELPVLPDRLVYESDDIERYPERDLMLQALGCLKDQDREALILSLEGYSNADIADLLSISTSAAQSRTYRALKRLTYAYEKLNELPQGSNAVEDGEAWPDRAINQSMT